MENFFTVWSNAGFSLKLGGIAIGSVAVVAIFCNGVGNGLAAFVGVWRRREVWRRRLLTAGGRRLLDDGCGLLHGLRARGLLKNLRERRLLPNAGLSCGWCENGRGRRVTARGEIHVGMLLAKIVSGGLPVLRHGRMRVLRDGGSDGSLDDQGVDDLWLTHGREVLKTSHGGCGSDGRERRLRNRRRGLRRGGLIFNLRRGAHG